MNEGTNTIEQLFDNAGEAIDTLVGVASFRRLRAGEDGDDIG